MSLKKVPQTGKWVEADEAYARGQEAYIDWCRAIAEIDATQQEIADRYDVDQSHIARHIAVGRDERLMRSTHTSLPKSTYTLYLLTTLDDEGFGELCKPDTTQAKVNEYKRRLNPPTSPPPPPRPKAEPQRMDPEDVSDADIRQAMGLEPELSQPDQLHPDWMFHIFGIKKAYGLTEETIDVLYRHYMKKAHPDRSGSTEEAAQLNAARKILKERYEWNVN